MRRNQWKHVNTSIHVLIPRQARLTPGASHHVASRHVTSRHVRMHHVTSRLARLAGDVTSRHVLIPRQARLTPRASRSVTSRYVSLHVVWRTSHNEGITRRHIRSRDVILRHVVTNSSPYHSVTSRHVTSRQPSRRRLTSVVRRVSESRGKIQQFLPV